jgi:hypothetical protein
MHNKRAQKDEHGHRPIRMPTLPIFDLVEVFQDRSYLAGRRTGNL